MRYNKRPIVHVGEDQYGNKCLRCGGQGWYSDSEHHPGCPGYGEFCYRMCPVEVQIECEHCYGTGKELESESGDE